MERHEASIDFDNEIRKIYLNRRDYVYKIKNDILRSSEVQPDDGLGMDFLLAELKDKMIESAQQSIDLMEEMLAMNEIIAEIKGTGSFLEQNIYRTKCWTDLNLSSSTFSSDSDVDDMLDEESTYDNSDDDRIDTKVCSTSCQEEISFPTAFNHLLSSTKLTNSQSSANVRDSGFYEKESDDEEDN